MNEKHILLLSSGVGQGHHTAAAAIRQALARRYPESVKTTTINVLDHPDTSHMLREGQSDYDWIATDLPQIHELARRMTNTKLTRGVTEMAQILMFYRPIASIMKEYQPDIIVSLYPAYQSSILAYLQLHHSHIPLITVPTDLGILHRLWFHPGVDLCLVPNHSARELAQKNGLNPHQIRVTGLPVNPALAERPPSKIPLRESLGWHPDILSLLVVGSRRTKALEPFAHILNHAGYPLQLILVSGGNESLYQYFRDESWHRPVFIYDYIENMADMMQAADCILTKAGGLITSESLAAGLPLLFNQALLKQEKGNADFVVQHGAGDLAEEPLELLETFCHWMDEGGALLMNRAANAAKLGRPEAAYNVAEAVVQMMSEAREARIGLENEESSFRDIFQYFGIKL